MLIQLALYPIEMPFNAFANRADPDQAALIRAALSGSTLFAYRNMSRYDPTLVVLPCNFYVQTFQFINIHSVWSLA